MATPQKIKVPVTDLKIGMYVCELDRPWLETRFLTQGFPLLDVSDIEAVRRECEFVFIDAARGKSYRPPRNATPARTRQRTVDRGTARNGRPSLLSKFFRSRREAPVTTELVKPLRSAQAVHDDARSLVKTVFDDVKLGASIDTPQAKEVVARCVDQVVENADAMLLLTSIRNKDDYTAEHSLNVSILSIVLGKALGLGRAELEEVGTCGLLHDVGKILSPDDVLKKPGRLTPEEFLVMKMHPSQGRDILMGSNGVIGSSIDVAHGHHERLDGSGYPRGLVEESLTTYTRLVSVVDVYDAITSHRVYASGRSHIEAFKILQSQGGNHFDSAMVTSLIAAIGIYPPGSVVELSNGDIGIVVRSNPKKRLQPKVLLLKDAGLKPKTPRFLDLADPETNKGNGLRIVRQRRADDVGVDVYAFRSSGYLGSLEP